MEKYRQTFRISIRQELAYRSRFVVDRLRNVLQVFLVFFLWDSVFSSPGREVFGYDRAKILTYVFVLLVIRMVVTGSRVSEISGIIARGELSNYLLKPMSFLRHWFARDLSSRTIHTLFAMGEAGLLYAILRPPFYLQTDVASLAMFGVLLGLAMVMFFLMLAWVSMIPFWMPEQTWPPVFLFLTVSEILSGALFPLDIFPEFVLRAMLWLPFPYLLFVPVQVYLGKISGWMMMRSVVVMAGWVAVLMGVTKWTWRRGLLQYRAEGR